MTRQLGLGKNRELAIRRTAAIVRRIWAGFDSARDAEPDAGPEIREVVPLAHVPSGVADADDHQRRLCHAINRDGRVFLSTAIIDGRTWLRPCFTNFRTQPSDVDTLFDVIVEQSSRMVPARSA